MHEHQRQQLNDDGFCVFPSVLSPAELERIRAALDRAIADKRRQTGSTHDARLDPNDANIRIYDLPALDPKFIALLVRNDALAAVAAMLGEHFLISNFTANVALPGSQSMKLHSDQALVVPGPWRQPWACNIIWCLDDVDKENGATRYLPGSHRFQSVDDVPPDAMAQTRAFTAPAGSFVAMEGRLWHTSGANISKDRQRRMMFAYYVSDFRSTSRPASMRANGLCSARPNMAMFGLVALSRDWSLPGHEPYDHEDQRLSRQKVQSMEPITVPTS